MKILAFLTDPPVVQGVLLPLDLPHRPPPVAPARGPRRARGRTPDDVARGMAEEILEREAAP